MHLLAGGLFWLLAGAEAMERDVLLAVQLAVLGIGMVVCGFLRQQGNEREPRREFISLAGGGVMLAAGLTIAIFPQTFAYTFYLHLLSYQGLYAAIFVISGALMILTQCCRKIFPFDPAIVETGVYTLAGLTLISIVATDHLLEIHGLNSTYYGWYGLVLAAFPWSRRHLGRFNPRLLHTRISMILSIAVALILIFTFSIGTGREEDIIRERTLNLQQSRATALAGSIREQIQGYQASLLALSLQPHLMEMRDVDKIEQLEQFQEAFPHFEDIDLYSDVGSLLAQIGDPAVANKAVILTLIVDVRSSHQMATSAEFSPDLHRALFRIASPILDRQGNLEGVLIASVSSAPLHDYLLQQGLQTNSQVYLIDDRGRAIDHPDPTLTSSFADLSASAPVAAALNSGETDGAFSLYDADTELIVGYASVPDLGWRVFVQQPSSEALGFLYQARNNVMALLMVFLLFVIIGGQFLSARLTAPLQVLNDTVNHFAAGNLDVLVPRTRIIEIDQLAQAFENMRRRLIARTLEREQAEKALREAYLEMEDKVVARTRDLNLANERLKYELDERTRAEELLRSTSERLRVTTEAIGMGLWDLDLVHHTCT